ncbi:oxygen-dependent protoporphyrinogen oxidase [Pontibacter aydingkolensis]|uniref:Coproporphyrinogen III oxidase n=1 Tax=Pontibacter aydingkolensis TaxID=1911536 RepID=A0ABS7CY81_9BACT|nr:protoporphyrinogen oxidase [Pontibacter aydingkolensis]MBW7468785.1 protoporphyrinogen oxidase [Pontibacter aydingkolensis]
MRVAIIGAGISGLALAYYLQKLGVAYDLFEASSQVGGAMRTVKTSGYILELGPNSLQTSPELKELIRELKLDHEVLPAAPLEHQRYVLRDGDYHQLPTSPFSLLSNNFFSWKTKYRILQEKNIPPADIDYETVSQFFERRFGKDVVAYGVNPVINGMYAGDPNQLLVHKAMPHLKAMEKKFGSVLRGLVHHRDSYSRQEVFSFVEGMSTMPNAIAGKLVSLHTEHRVEMITRAGGKYVISCGYSGDYDTEEYDILVLALPAYQAAELLHFTFPGMAAALQNINYPPMAMVYSVYNRHDVGHHLKGFGALHPKVEDTFAAGSIWTSSVFDGRCRPHEVMFTTFVGGSQYAPNALVERSQQMRRVHEELRRLYNINTDKPIFQYAHLWEHSIPQYDLYIEDAHDIAKTLEQDGLFIAANWQAGVSVPGCIKHAKELAHKINLKRPLFVNS